MKSRVTRLDPDSRVVGYREVDAEPTHVPGLVYAHVGTGQGAWSLTHAGSGRGLHWGCCVDSLRPVADALAPLADWTLDAETLKAQKGLPAAQSEAKWAAAAAATCGCTKWQGDWITADQVAALAEFVDFYGDRRYELSTRDIDEADRLCDAAYTVLEALRTEVQR